MKQTPIFIQQRRFYALMTCFLTIAACQCEEYERLTITDPEDGVTLTAEQDVNSSEDGFQYNVTVEAKGVLDGETIKIYPDASVIEEDSDAVAPYEGIVEDETVTVEVTLEDGENRIIACKGTSCKTKSLVVTVNVDFEQDACPAMAFTSPVPGEGDTVHLDETDDEDGTACGETFATQITAQVDADDGTEVQLIVNDVAAAVATVSDNTVDFGAVILGNRGDTPNSLQIALLDGSGCTESFAQPLFVDCAGPSCSITQPATASTLNSDFDINSETAGMQLLVEVTTDANATGENETRLIINEADDSALTSTATADGENAVALFNSVSLDEGTVLLQAECQDPEGNITRSTVGTWFVDTVGCDVAVSNPTAAQDIIGSDDLDTTTDGIQIASDGTITGEGCESFRVALCSSVEGVSFAELIDGAFSSSVTLATDGAQEICAQALDDAGNISSTTVSVNVQTNAPAVAISSPLTGARFNVAGGEFESETYTADLNTETAACDVAFEVDCELVGRDVELINDEDDTVLATATCVEDEESTLNGRATLSAVALPETSTSLTVFARQAVSSLAGTSEPIVLAVDCQAPSLSIESTICGAVVSPSDDLDGDALGIQVPVAVSSPNDPQLDVALNITAVDGGMTSYSSELTSEMAAEGVFTFADATLSAAGDFDVVASTVDAFGNSINTDSCEVTVVDLPTLEITAPSNGLVVSLANENDVDCSADEGLQIQVTATTNATDGSAANVEVDEVTEGDVTSGTFTACVDVPQGTSDITVTVTDGDSTDGVSGFASASIQITVDTVAPTDAILPAITIIEHRIATAEFSFTAVGDTDGSAFSSYLLRCADTSLEDASDADAWWDEATEIAVADIPSAVGADEAISVGSMESRIFRTGTHNYCVMRAFDAVGNISTLPNESTDVFPEFEVTQVDPAVTNTAMGYTGAVPVGDVNGDGFPDVLVSGTNGDLLFGGTAVPGAAFLYFGGNGNPVATDSPDVEFTRSAGITGSALGNAVAGIGDFNGDDLPDFAISDAAENDFTGAVYIFFGRDTDTPWDATIDMGDGSTCPADVCIRGSDAFEFLGYGIAGVGDFDGDGDDDIAIGRTLYDQVIIISGFNATSGQEIVIDTDDGDTSNDPDGFIIQGVIGDGLTTDPTDTDPDDNGDPDDDVDPVLDYPSDFGWYVLGAGDITGSAHTDIIILEAGFDSITFQSSRPHLYRVEGRAGSTGLTIVDGTEVVEIATGQRLGMGIGVFGAVSTMSVLDFDFDGFMDFAIKQPEAGSRGVRVFFGDEEANYTFANSVEVRAATAASNDFFGVMTAAAFQPSLNSVSDIDGDGIDDLLSGSSQAGADTTPSAGLVYGRGSIAVSNIDWVNSRDAAVLQPEPLPVTSSQVFRLVGFVGDMDNDGFNDLIVTDPYANGTEPNGRFFLLH